MPIKFIQLRVTSEQLYTDVQPVSFMCLHVSVMFLYILQLQMYQLIYFLLPSGRVL